MAVKQLWTTPPQFVDANGDPYSGAYLFFYAAGSSTKQDTFTDDTGGTACPNPITLNASGYPAVSGTILAPWGTVGQTYKIGLAAPGSSDPPASFIWSQDDVAPINDTTVTIDQWVSGPTPTYVSATSFTLVGDQTGTFQVGRRLKTTNTAGTVYSTIVSSSFAAVTTVTVVNDSGSLDSGLSAVSYGLLSYTNTAAVSNGELRSVQVFTSNGTYTKPTTGLKRAVVEALGGGGGGAGATTNAAEAAVGGGGGAGGYSIRVLETASIGATETVTIGAAGSGGNGNANGSAGGNTTFGALLTANGGAGGGNLATGTTAGFGVGGASGTGANGLINTGVSSPGTYGTRMNGTTAIAGSGGSSRYGQGGAGTGSDGNGAAATGYGGGGAGAVSYNAGGTRDGGAGTAGLVVVWEYF